MKNSVFSFISCDFLKFRFENSTLIPDNRILRFIMNQSERRLFLINKLIYENKDYSDVRIPSDEDGQKKLLRSLMNVREAAPLERDVLKVQDEYLAEELSHKNVVKLSDLDPIQKDIYVWRGDITLLQCDAIVNAANSGMTGCYVPCHLCIDNCIHTFAGMQLRLYCGDMMKKQGHEEPTGHAKITPAFNLPSKYVIHTVGPIIRGTLTQNDRRMLSSCYSSCLKVAEENKVLSIAFCCISTGVFHFPKESAAQIAVETVNSYKASSKSGIKVIFNVFSEQDEILYRRILSEKTL